MSLAVSKYLETSVARHVAYDQVGPAVLLCNLAPAIVGAYFLAAADNGTLKPVITQERVGYGENGKMIIRKFQTIPDADPNEITEINGTIDPRATWRGNLLRTTGLDESLQPGVLPIFGVRPKLEDDYESLEVVAPVLSKDLRVAGELYPGFMSPGSAWEKTQEGHTDRVKIISALLELGYIEKASGSGDVELLGLIARIMLRVKAKQAAAQIMRKYMPTKQYNVEQYL